MGQKLIVKKRNWDKLFFYFFLKKLWNSEIWKITKEQKEALRIFDGSLYEKYVDMLRKDNAGKWEQTESYRAYRDVQVMLKL
jgi:hypothetical protein